MRIHEHYRLLCVSVYSQIACNVLHMCVYINVTFMTEILKKIVCKTMYVYVYSNCMYSNCICTVTVCTVTVYVQ